MNMRKRVRLVYGVGINDADYLVKPRNASVCPFYQRWHSMLGRCYSKCRNKSNKSYSNCTVCDEWLTFSNFKSWMQTQHWQGMHLDKDIASKGNKVYSSSTCVFVDPAVNSFFVLSPNGVNRKTGVYFDKRQGKYRVQVSNFNSGEIEYLGSFNLEIDAASAYRERKIEIAELLKSRTDEPVVIAAIDRVIAELKNEQQKKA